MNKISAPKADIMIYQAASMPTALDSGLLVDSEWVARKNNRLTRLIKDAGYAFTDACVEDIEYRADRKLDKAQIKYL